MEDKKAIQVLIAQWIAASKEGDYEKAKALIHPKAQFMVPGMGTATMDGESFAKAATARQAYNRI